MYSKRFWREIRRINTRGKGGGSTSYRTSNSTEDQHVHHLYRVFRAILCPESVINVGFVSSVSMVCVTISKGHVLLLMIKVSNCLPRSRTKKSSPGGWRRFVDVFQISCVRLDRALLHDVPDSLTGVALVARRVIRHAVFRLGVAAPPLLRSNSIQTFESRSCQPHLPSKSNPLVIWPSRRSWGNIRELSWTLSCFFILIELSRWRRTAARMSVAIRRETTSRSDSVAKIAILLVRHWRGCRQERIPCFVSHRVLVVPLESSTGRGTDHTGQLELQRRLVWLGFLHVWHKSTVKWWTDRKVGDISNAHSCYPDVSVHAKWLERLISTALFQLGIRIPRSPCRPVRLCLSSSFASHAASVSLAVFSHRGVNLARTNRL